MKPPREQIKQNNTPRWTSRSAGRRLLASMVMVSLMTGIGFMVMPLWGSRSVLGQEAISIERPPPSSVEEDTTSMEEAFKRPAERVRPPTLDITKGQVAIGIGYSWGEGTLTYQGKKYPVSVSGLSVIDVGITKATAKGKVYNLKKLEDFNGNYTAVTAEGTLGVGAGATTIKNQNGVVIDLVTTPKGLNLRLVASGVSLKIKQ